MFSTFNLTSLLLGVFISVPFILGCLLLLSSFLGVGLQTKAQRVAGVLFMVFSLYMVARTLLLIYNDIGSEFERTTYYVLDSTVITMFGLVPATIILERYPKWWHYPIAISPLILIPIVYLTNLYTIAIWSHLMPIMIGLIVLIHLNGKAHRIDVQLPNYFANPELHTKAWIIRISALYLLLTCMSMFRYIMPGHIGYNMIIHVAWCITMFVLFIFLIRQLPVAQSEEITEQPNATTYASPSANNTAPKTIGENKNKAFESIRLALDEKCVKEQLYLDRDLSLYTLARVCGTNRTYLTDYLHDQLNQTFYEYINTLRLVHVDELMEKTKFSQEAIALKCGFNNAQTMRSAYRKIRGRELKMARKALE